MAKRTTNSGTAGTTSANVGYESQLWHMADALRGSMDAAEYKHVVLGLLFLKYISDIDARKMSRMVDRTHRELTDEDIARIARTYHAWRGEKEAGEYADVPGFCKSAPLEEVRKHGHVLTPGRYVGAEAVEDDGEPFEEKMKRLTVLALQIDASAHARHGKAASNFAALLPAPQSDLAQQTLKDPYIFDFLTLTEPLQERELETELVRQASLHRIHRRTGRPGLARNDRLAGRPRPRPRAGHAAGRAAGRG